MKFRHIFAMIAVAAAVSVSSAVLAQSKDPLEKLDTISPEQLFKGILREEDVTLLFRHLRESMAAAARGEEARESEALNRRSQEISRELTARGSVLMGAMLSAFEAAAKQALREGFSERTPQPATPRPGPSN